MTCKQCAKELPGLCLIDGLCHACTNSAFISARYDAEGYKALVLQLLDQIKLGESAPLSVTPQLPLTKDAVEARIQAWRARLDQMLVEQLKRLDKTRMDALGVVMEIDREIGSVSHQRKQ